MPTPARTWIAFLLIRSCQELILCAEACVVEIAMLADVRHSTMQAACGLTSLVCGCIGAAAYCHLCGAISKHHPKLSFDLLLKVNTSLITLVYCTPAARKSGFAKRRLPFWRCCSAVASIFARSAALAMPCCAAPLCLASGCNAGACSYQKSIKSFRK